MKKNNKPAAKRYMKTVGMVMASVMVLSSTTGQMVYAESAKDQKDTQDGEKKEEKTIVYLNGQTGNDKNSGESQDEAVKSFEKAADKYLKENPRFTSGSGYRVSTSTGNASNGSVENVNATINDAIRSAARR